MTALKVRSCCGLIYSLVAVFVSCNQPFDPQGAFNQRLVIFSILSTDRNVQVVRVEQSYAPNGGDLLAYNMDNFVANAKVILTGADSTMQLNDTTFARVDTTRFKYPLRAYASRPYIPQYGSQYVISVQTDQFGTAGGKVTIPEKSHLAWGAGAEEVLNSPGSHQPGDAIPCYVLLSDIAKGYIARLFVDYSVYLGGQWVDQRAEVPVAFIYSGTKDFRWVTYAQLMRRPTTHEFIQAYRNDIYAGTLINVSFDKYPTNKLVFKRIVYQFLQVEENLYNYYLLAHQFNDPRTLRLDQPDFTNVMGGVGVIGAYTLDSLTHTLPDVFVYNRR